RRRGRRLEVLQGPVVEHGRAAEHPSREPVIAVRPGDVRVVNGNEGELVREDSLLPADLAAPGREVRGRTGAVRGGVEGRVREARDVPTRGGVRGMEEVEEVVRGAARERPRVVCVDVGAR